MSEFHALTPQARRRIFHAIGPGELVDFIQDVSMGYFGPYMMSQDEGDDINDQMERAFNYALNHEGWGCKACSEIPSTAPR